MKNNLLIVIQDDSLRTVFSQCLTYEGYRVDAAGDGVDALSLVKKDSHALMIVDDEYLALSGLQLVETVRKNCPALRVALFCTLGDDSVREGVKRLGVTDFLVDPFDMQSVLKNIKKILVV